MALHAVAVVAVGVAPALALRLFEAALGEFPIGRPAASSLQSIGGAIWASRALAAVLLGAGFVAWRRGRTARRSVTWACGYTAGSPRMQYTGSAFVESFARVFHSFLPSLRRERLPEGPFPQHASHAATHHADPVEKRLFEVLGQGEEFISQLSERIPENPRVAFAAGLLVIVVIGILVAGGLK
jgi:hydrogenase-4 component B